MRRAHRGPRTTYVETGGPARAGCDAAELVAPAQADHPHDANDSHAPFDPPDLPSRLNMAERLVARLGEWVGALPEWWMPEYIPAFAGDAQVAARCSAFATESAAACGSQA